MASDESRPAEIAQTSASQTDFHEALSASRGAIKLSFTERLVDDWGKLADILAISPADQQRFDKGDEARGIWAWLEVRHRLAHLPEALRLIQRDDLADVCADLESVVFLAHSSPANPDVGHLARRLHDEAQLEIFLDKWHLVPGDDWVDELGEALNASRSCTVLLGPDSVGPWEHEEMRATLARRSSQDHNFRVIPVLLPGAAMPDKGSLPPFLNRLHWQAEGWVAGHDDDLNALEREFSAARN